MNTFLRSMLWDFRALQRSRVALAAVLLTLLLCALAAIEGRRTAGAWQTHVNAAAAAKEDGWKTWAKKPPANAEDIAMLLFAQKASLSLPPAPLSDLATGRNDLDPKTGEAGTFAQSQVLFRNYQISGPVVTALGRFDLAFVVQWLLPLLIVGLGHGILAEDRSRGIDRLLLVQGASMRRLVMARLVARAALTTIPLLLVFGALYLFAPEGVAQAAQRSERMAWAVLLTLAYLAFWWALVVWVNTLKLRQTQALTLLILLWACTTLILPGIAGVASRQLHPAPSRHAFIAETRMQEIAATKRSKELMGGYVHDHPDLDPEKVSELPWWVGIHLVSKEVDAAVSPKTAAFDAALLRQQSAVKQWRFLSPALMLQQGLAALAGTDETRASAFRQQGGRFFNSYRDATGRLLIVEQKANLEQLRVLSRFTFDEPDAGDAIKQAALSALLMLACTLLLLVLAAHRLKRQCSSPLRASQLALVLLLVIPTFAHAQRADSNAVKDAEDAFGSSIGNESIGLYSTSSVRGFSPRQAGNMRIEGMYFDERAWLSERAWERSRVRVGLAASGYPFPAPTGIIDYSLRKPEGERVISVVTGLYEWGGSGLEVDAKLPIQGNVLGVAAGVSVVNEHYYDGSTALSKRAYGLLRWWPNARVDVMPFFSTSLTRGEEPGPFIVAQDGQLPPDWPSSKYLGPRWAQGDYLYTNNGVIGKFGLSPHWSLALAGIHSKADNQHGFSDVFLQTGSQRMRELVYLSRHQGSRSYSGEARLTWLRTEGPRLHKVHFSLRGRERVAHYGGAASIDLGERDWATPLAATVAPVATLGAQTEDRIQQTTFGIAYEGRWKNVGELNAGVMRTHYRKDVLLPAQARQRSEDAPTLAYLSVAAFINPRWAVYAGHTRGLEESGIAPESASNRQQPLPAIHTRQTDAGLRWKIDDALTMAMGVFDVRKPYFSFDGARRYVMLGEVQHRGVEASLSGRLGKQWNVVLGGVWLDAHVDGAPVATGVLGKRPVGTTPLTLRGNVEHRIQAVPGLSLDVGLWHRGGVIASDDNRLHVPAATLWDVGVRYAFPLAVGNASLRATVSNASDVRSWAVMGANAFMPTARRSGSLILSVDF